MGFCGPTCLLYTMNDTLLIQASHSYGGCSNTRCRSTPCRAPVPAAKQDSSGTCMLQAPTTNGCNQQQTCSKRACNGSNAAHRYGTRHPSLLRTASAVTHTRVPSSPPPQPLPATSRPAGQPQTATRKAPAWLHTQPTAAYPAYLAYPASACPLPRSAPIHTPLNSGAAAPAH